MLSSGGEGRPLRLDSWVAGWVAWVGSNEKYAKGERGLASNHSNPIVYLYRSERKRQQDSVQLSNCQAAVGACSCECLCVCEAATAWLMLFKTPRRWWLQPFIFWPSIRLPVAAGWQPAKHSYTCPWHASHTVWNGLHLQVRVFRQPILANAIWKRDFSLSPCFTNAAHLQRLPSSLQFSVTVRWHCAPYKSYYYYDLLLSVLLLYRLRFHRS